MLLYCSCSFEFGSSFEVVNIYYLRAMTQKTKKALRTSIVQVCSFLCMFILSSCKDAGPPKPVSVTVETVQKEIKYAEILEISPYGVVTLNIITELTSWVEDFGWYDYRVYERSSRGPSVWKTYGHSIPYILKGPARVGDRVNIFEVLETKVYPSGEVYTETSEVFVQKKE